MLEEKEKVGNLPGAPILDERLLQFSGFAIRDGPEMPYFERTVGL